MSLNAPKKVLTFRASSIGDCLMGKYLLENIHAANPDTVCELVVSSRVKMIRELLVAYPWLHVVELNRHISTLLRFFGGGRRDIVVTPYTGGTFPLLPKLVARLAAHTLIGYTDRSSINKFLYSKLISLVGRERAPRLLETDALSALGMPVSIAQPSFKYVPQPALLSRLGLEGKKYVVLHLFSGSDARGLSPSRRRELVEAIVHILPAGFWLVITGSDAERKSLDMGLPTDVILAKTSLQELAHLIDHSALMVSLDTGAAHIAAHLKKPLIVLAGCVGVQWWSKDMYGTDIPMTLFTNTCPSGHNYSGYAKCLDDVSMDEVAEKVEELFV